MTKLTTYQYNLIDDVFKRPMFYAISDSSRLIESLSYADQVLKDEASQSVINDLRDRLKSCDGAVDATMIVESEIDKFKDLLLRIYEHRNNAKD